MINLGLEQLVKFTKSSDGFTLDFGSGYTVKFLKNGNGFIVDVQPICDNPVVPTVIQFDIESVIFGGLTFSTDETGFTLLVNGVANPYVSLGGGRFSSEITTSGNKSLQLIKEDRSSLILYRTITINESNPCQRAPTLYDEDGNPAILNISSTGLTFRFDGEGITSIAWTIGLNGNTIREGIVNVTTNVVPITFQSIDDGSYTFSITGDNCSSGISSKTFSVLPEIVEPSSAFTLQSTNDFDLGLDSPNLGFFDSWGVVGKIRSAMQNIARFIGFDYATIAGRYESRTDGGVTRDVLTNWVQRTVSASSSVNNIVQDGNKTYYFRPSGYTTNMSYNMFDFHTRFPNFTPIEGKLVSIQSVPFSEQEQALMIQKGVTHVRRGVPNQNKVFFWSDVWLDDVKDVNGQSIFLPPAYTEPESARQNFYDVLDPYQMAAQLYAQFQLNNLLDYGYIFWNYERVATWDDRLGTWGNVQPRSGDVGKPKKQIFFEEFARLKPSTLKFVAWTKKPIVINPAWLNQNTKAAWDAVYSGTVTSYAQLDQVFVNNNLEPRMFPNGVSSVAPMDIYHVGFYQSGHRIHIDFFYKHVMEAYLNKKLASAGKKVIGTLWVDNETLPSNDVNTEFKSVTRFGETLQIPLKPIASYSYMQSFAIWMTAIADGFDIWEYREFLEDQGTWDRLKNPSLDFQAPHFPTASLKGVDWAMSGYISLKQNEDILLANTQWTFPIDPWTAAGGYFGQGAKHPLVAWKLNSSGTSALVLAMNAYNDELNEVNVPVVINGATHQIVINHKYTSVVRVSL